MTLNKAHHTIMPHILKYKREKLRKDRKEKGEQQ